MIFLNLSSLLVNIVHLTFTTMCYDDDSSNVFANHEVMEPATTTIHKHGGCSEIINLTKRNIEKKEFIRLHKQWLKNNSRVLPPKELIGITSSKLITRSFVYDIQQVLHIIPFEEVSQRLNSYEQWPKDAKIWPPALAEAGFFYFGDKLDKYTVQCSTCGIQANIKDWDCKDSALDVHAKLNPNCEFLKTISYSLNRRKQLTDNSKDNTTSFKDKNTPIEDKNGITGKRKLLINGDDEKDSPTSFSNQHKQETISPLATNFHSESPTDGVVFKYPQYSSLDVRLQSFGRWNLTDVQSPNRLAECGYFYTGEADIVRCFCCDLGLAEWDISDDPWLEHARHSTKCWFLIEIKGKAYVEQVQSDWKKIYNPKHPAFEDKLARKATFDEKWRTDIEQTAEILVDAGFFYEGEEDVVRCHYCDGGLRHWEQGDIPWEEHARWFPFCKFVIKMKGRDYIEAIKIKHEDQSREDLRSQTMDMVSETNHAPVIKFILEMGFCLSDVTYATTKYTREKGNSNYNTEDLLSILIERHEEEKINKDITDTEDILKKNQQLKKSMMCIQCKQKEKCILFVNCGHRVTCNDCGYHVENCPYCGTKIKNRLKTFLS